ncbi:hypothetical protein D3C73_1370350 [compost metagenome]
MPCSIGNGVCEAAAGPACAKAACAAAPVAGAAVSALSLADDGEPHAVTAKAVKPRVIILASAMRRKLLTLSIVDTPC